MFGYFNHNSKLTMPPIFFTALYLKAKMMMNIPFLNLKRCDPAFVEFSNFVSLFKKWNLGFGRLRNIHSFTLMHNKNTKIFYSKSAWNHQSFFLIISFILQEKWIVCHYIAPLTNEMWDRQDDKKRKSSLIHLIKAFKPFCNYVFFFLTLYVKRV